MRRDTDITNAQLQLEVAVRKLDPAAIVAALKVAWDDNLSWKDALKSQDIAKVNH